MMATTSRKYDLTITDKIPSLSSLITKPSANRGSTGTKTLFKNKVTNVRILFAKISTFLFLNFEKTSPAKKPENNATLFETKEGNLNSQKGFRVPEIPACACWISLNPDKANLETLKLIKVEI